MIDCYHMDDAEYVFVMLGSFSTKAREAVDSLRAAGWKAGLLRPRLFRPLPQQRIRQLLRGRRAVGVIDQNISMGMGGVLHSEFATALYGLEDAPLHPQRINRNAQTSGDCASRTRRNSSQLRYPI
jgi:pyruvate ferredoxin oxidoreductase alpha subunit